MTHPSPQKGRVLRPGDTIGIVAPSGPVPPEALTEAIARLESWGYKVLVGDHVLAQHGYLAGTDAQRAADFNAIFTNPGVAGVICARGGYGAMRILDLLDWERIAGSPKFFCGFSDITALHLALEQRAGLVTFHGPMAATSRGAAAYNDAGLLRAMRTRVPLGDIPWPAPEADAAKPTTIRPGVAEGRLYGGNLALLSGLMGTAYAPNFTGRIVLIEEIDEAPYAIDRMLTQLLLGGTLQRAAGILFGGSASCMQHPEGKPSLTLLEVLADRLGPLGIPVLYGFPCGHEAHRATLPLGVQVRLDATAGTLRVLEAALTP